MAKIVKLNCRKIYVTDDNPRRENPAEIRKEIINNIKGSVYFNIGNREKAISKAVSNAAPNETILVAGKGHENYQDYGDKIISISDKRIIQNLKVNKIKKNNKNQNYIFNSKILEKILKNKMLPKFDGFVLDSRNVKKNNLFLAIKGKKMMEINLFHKRLKKVPA